MDVTLFGIVTEVRLLQLKKARLPMEITLLGMMTEVRPVQPEKADSPMVFMFSDSVIFLILEKPLNNDVTFSQSKETSSILLQPKNRLFPIIVGLLFTITDVRPLQLEKALLPMDVTLLGMVTEIRPLLP